jgi:hypothetical protein
MQYEKLGISTRAIKNTDLAYFERLTKKIHKHYKTHA